MRIHRSSARQTLLSMLVVLLVVSSSAVADTDTATIANLTLRKVDSLGGASTSSSPSSSPSSSSASSAPSPSPTASSAPLLSIEGIYGTFGPIRPVQNAVLIRADPINGCRPYTNIPTNLPANYSWIPIVTRSQDGNCSFSDKTRIAMNAGASAVIIMNYDPVKIVVMSAPTFIDFPTVAVSGSEGNQLLSLISGAESTGAFIIVDVAVGDELALYQVIFSKLFFDIAIFFMVFCAVAGFVLSGYYFQRRRLLREARESQEKLERQTKLAVAALPTKPYVRSPDKTADDEDDACAVCLDAFEPGTLVRVIPCGHEFHVDCIDPWLIAHRTCPLCKQEITIFDNSASQAPRDEEAAMGSRRASHLASPTGSTGSTRTVFSFTAASQPGPSVSSASASTVSFTLVSLPVATVAPSGNAPSLYEQMGAAATSNDDSSSSDGNNSDGNKDADSSSTAFAFERAESVSSLSSSASNCAEDTKLIARNA